MAEVVVVVVAALALGEAMELLAGALAEVVRAMELQTAEQMSRSEEELQPEATALDQGAFLLLVKCLRLRHE